MTSLIKQSIGVILLLMGVAGLFLPLMPGLIFIILGAALLGSKNRLVVKVKMLVRHRFYRGESHARNTSKTKL